MLHSQKVCVVGCGPVGCYVSLMLAKRGFEVEILEKRPELARTLKQEGRSINLALCIRGIKALEKLNLQELLKTGVLCVGGSAHGPNGEIYNEIATEK